MPAQYAPTTNTNSVATYTLADLSSSDLSQLTAIRRKNQAKESAEGVRTTKAQSEEISEDTRSAQKKKTPSERMLLSKKIYEIVRLESEKGSSTGLNRSFRYGKTAAGSMTTGDDSVSGNTANAQVAARAGAAAVSSFSPPLFSVDGN